MDLFFKAGIAGSRQAGLTPPRPLQPKKRIAGSPRFFSKKPGSHLLLGAWRLARGELGVHLADAEEEGAQQRVAVREVRCAHHLAARVHRELGHADVARAHAESRGEDRADGRAARAIVLHHKLLHGCVAEATQLAHHERRLHSGRIPLVCVVLDDHSPSHVWAVALLVLRPVVGVHGVCVVEREQKRFAEPPLSQLTARRGPHSLRHAREGLLHHRSARARRRVGAHLLVVEERHAADRLALRQLRVGGAVGERFECHEGGGEVVQPPAAHELGARAGERGRLRVEER
mmetsp:Transcript_41755/g.103025  ORF Transcript_41755/g.103025 Transcript_41755/m.103025 type:complete len:289 (-) Transcript_41755:950-1816(-)